MAKVNYCNTCEKNGFPQQQISFSKDLDEQGNQKKSEHTKSGLSWIIQNPDGSIHEHKKQAGNGGGTTLKQETPKQPAIQTMNEVDFQNRLLDIAGKIESHLNKIEQMMANQTQEPTITTAAELNWTKPQLQQQTPRETKNIDYSSVDDTAVETDFTDETDNQGLSNPE